MTAIHLPEVDECAAYKDWRIRQDESEHAAAQAPMASGKAALPSSSGVQQPASAASTNAAGQDDKELPGSADAVRRSQLSPAPAASRDKELARFAELVLAVAAARSVS